MPYSNPGDKAGPLRYTKEYVYNIADCLGKGATANVFLGRDRSRGTQVAIKVFPENETAHLEQARRRETELLQTVNHRNLMRLLACDREELSGQHVIVMPYCQCGSVYSLLEQPQNGFGLQEPEFLRFLRDISNGLQYLKQKNIIHRDIKPGNIMKGIEEDGSSVYILTDFGAARELQEDEETFMSIYGTEEYIHPGMFQRAVLREAGQTRFDSSVDLWSLAVTIYHVATGTLPFQSYGGRNDSQMTFKIISERKSGEISGIQSQSGGTVERSRQLPETCYISKGLRRLVEPILAGLFEPDTSRTMSFEQYFEAVNDISSSKTLKVFFAQTGTEEVLYLRKTDCFVHIQETIASLTDIAPERQILLLEHTNLREVVELNEQIQSFPKSVQSSELFLFEKDYYEVHKLSFPTTIPPFPAFTVGSSVSNDAQIARKSAAIAYFIEWKTTQIQRTQSLLLEAKLQLRLFVQHTVQPQERTVPLLDKHLDLTKRRTDSIHWSQQNVQNFLTLLESTAPELVSRDGLRKAVQEFCSKDGSIEEILHKTCNRCEEIKVYLSVLVQRLKECSNPSATDFLGCHDEDHCLTKVEHIRQGIQTISTTFSKHKKYGDLHPHEKFIHKVEREKLEDLCVKILSLFQGHCLPNLNKTHIDVNKHNSLLLKHLTRVGKVATNIECVIECQDQINDKLNQVDTRYHRVSELLKSNVRAILQNPGLVTKVPHGETCSTALPGEPLSSAKTSTTALSGESLSSATSLKEEKKNLMQRLMEEVAQLGTARAELDTLLSSNTESLLELKRMLENTSRLSPTSFANDRMSVECSDSSETNSTSGRS